MKILAVDTETTGLDVRKGCRPFAVYAYDGSEYHWWNWEVDPHTREVRVPKKDVKEIISLIDSYDRIVMHNHAFDIRMLESVGVIPRKGWFERLDDTGPMGHVLRSDKTQHVRGQLKEMSVIFLEYPKDDESRLQKMVVAARRVAKKKGWEIADHVAADYWLPSAVAKTDPLCKEDDPRLTVCDDYGKGDVLRTWSLHDLFSYGLATEGLTKAYERERKLFRVIYDMTSRGITLSKSRIDAEIRKRTSRICIASEKMRKILKDEQFNPSSVPQLRSALFDRLKFTPVKLTKSGASTDKAVIAELHSSAEKDGGNRLAFLDSLADYRKSSTARGYLSEYRSLLRDGRLYYNLKQHGTSTTRFSSQNPNSQNIGKGTDAFDEEGNPIVVDSLRAVFGPAKGRLWLAMDYSQLQLRIFAFEAGERSLIEAFENGWDAHDYVAHRIFSLPEEEKPTKIQRRIAKAVNFGFIFGASPAKIELTAGIPGLWDTVISIFPSAHSYMNRIKWSVRKNKYVTTKFGYRLYIPYRGGRLAEHAGVNYIVQGDEGDIVKNGMIRNHKYLDSIAPQFGDDRPFMTLQVHDEILYDFPIMPDDQLKKHAHKLKRNMERAGEDLGMITPVDCEIIRTTWNKSESFDV